MLTDIIVERKLISENYFQDLKKTEKKRSGEKPSIVRETVYTEDIGAR